MMVQPTPTQSALILLSQTSTDFLQYKLLVKLITNPNHSNIKYLLTPTIIANIRWLSAITKFTRFLLFYRYSAGITPPLDSVQVLAKLKTWIARDCTGSFHDIRLSRSATKALTKLWMSGLPQVMPDLRAALQILDSVLPQPAGLVSGISALVYEVLVKDISLEKAVRIHEEMTKLVMKWQKTIREDITTNNLSAERLENIKSLAPANIFFPENYVWPKFKPSEVLVMAGAKLMDINGNYINISNPTQPNVLVECRIDGDGGNQFISEEQCPICLNRWTQEDQLIKLSCGHIFHYSCIGEWFKSVLSADDDDDNSNKSTCPLCRLPCELKQLFHPDEIPFREPGKRGRDWCWEEENYPKHSPEHFFLNQQYCAGTHKLKHTTLQMWLYVREMYNHGRRLAYAVERLNWLPEGVTVQPYSGIGLIEDISGLDECLDTISPVAMIGFEDEPVSYLIDDPDRNRWEDFGWGGITRHFLRELGATNSDLEQIGRRHPGLMERGGGAVDEDLLEYRLWLDGFVG